MNIKKIAMISSITVCTATCAIGAIDYVSDTNIKIEKLNETIESNNNIIEEYKNINKKIQESVAELESTIDVKNSELEDARRKIEERNRLAYFNSYDVTEVSNATVSHMQRALKGTGLEYDAQSFIDAENVYGINAFFIASIAAQESAWGTSYRAQTQNNLTGHAVYNSVSRGSYFSSRGESIMNTAHLLKEDYVDANGKYYNGVSVVGVNTRYCLYEDGKSTDYGWSENISRIAHSLIEKANDFEKI